MPFGNLKLLLRLLATCFMRISVSTLILTISIVYDMYRLPQPPTQVQLHNQWRRKMFGDGGGKRRKNFALSIFQL